MKRVNSFIGAFVFICTAVKRVWQRFYAELLFLLLFKGDA